MNMKRISKMKKLPCIENKCILYPACRSKESIGCKELSQYYKLYMAIHMSYRSREIWFKINKTLPDLEIIRGEVINNVLHPRIQKPQKRRPLHQIPYGANRGESAK